MYQPETVALNFSKHAHHYDNYARIQQRAAAQMMKFVPEYLLEKEHIRILEIGCGTGLVSRNLVNVFDNASFFITDISEEMIDTCEQELPEYARSRTKFFTLDGQTPTDLADSEPFDLIISGFTLHWFQNPQETLNQWFDLLAEDGCMVWSFLNRGSFPEWKTICQEINVPCTLNVLPDMELMREPLNEKYSLEVSVIPMHQVYPSSQAFLNSIRLIGAGTSDDEQVLNVSQMRRLIHYWNASNPYGIEIKHLVSFLTLTK
jgi:malonyl-CoA O-methyltransferase